MINKKEYYENYYNNHKEKQKLSSKKSYNKNKYKRQIQSKEQRTEVKKIMFEIKQRKKLIRKVLNNPMKIQELFYYVIHYVPYDYNE